MKTYAKIKTPTTLEYFRQPIRIDGKDIFTTDPTPYGYKPVVIPESPSQDGYYAAFDGWEETETEIRQKWRLEPIPEEEE